MRVWSAVWALVGSIAYALLVLCIRLYSLYQAAREQGPAAVQGVLARCPWLHRVPWIPSAAAPHIGSAPKAPTILAIVLADSKLQERPGSADILTDLIYWAVQAGIEHVFVYDPQGWACSNSSVISATLDLKAQANGRTRVRVCIGFRPAIGSAVYPDQIATSHPERISPESEDPLLARLASNKAASTSRAAVRSRHDDDSNASAHDSHRPGTATDALVCILSASDAYWPIEAAMQLESQNDTACNGLASSSDDAAQSDGQLRRAHADYNGHAAGEQHQLANALHDVSDTDAERDRLSRLDEPSSMQLSSAVSPQQNEFRQRRGSRSLYVDSRKSPTLRFGQAHDVRRAPDAYDVLERAAGPLAVLEPDIVMVLGGVFTLAGYPPWLVRHSEIYDMGPLRRATRKGLESALQRFSSTKQRFGK